MKKYTRKIIEFYNKHSNDYIKNSAFVLENKINKFAKLINHEGRILDVGCGPGHDTNYLIRKGFNVLGIDLSKQMINYAKKNFKGKFELMDFFDLKFKKNTFDGIWCSAALIHVTKSDLNKILKSFFKILKENGVLGIIVRRFTKRVSKKEDRRIFTMFYKKEIEEYLIKNKFEIISSEIFSYAKIKWILIIAKST